MQNEHKGLDFRSGRVGKGKGIESNKVVEHGWEGNERANGVKAVKTWGLQTFYNAIAPETAGIQAEDRQGGRKVKDRANDHSKYQNWIDPAECVPYGKNAKEHTEKQIRNIANSIKRFGWQQDTVLTADNVLVIGHGRRLAAMKLGCMMPYHRIDKNADDLTDEDIRELRIADNQTNSETGYDIELLQSDIDDLDFDGFDFDFGIEIESEKAEKVDSVSLKDNFQLIIDCENEEDMQLKYEQLQEMGIECRTSTL